MTEELRAPNENTHRCMPEIGAGPQLNTLPCIATVPKKNGSGNLELAEIRDRNILLLHTYSGKPEMSGNLGSMNWAGYLSGSRRAIQIVAAWWGGEVTVTSGRHETAGSLLPCSNIQTCSNLFSSDSNPSSFYAELFRIPHSDFRSSRTENRAVWSLVRSPSRKNLRTPWKSWSGWLVSLRLIGVLNQQSVVSWWHCTHCNHEDIGVPNISNSSRVPSRAWRPERWTNRLTIVTPPAIFAGFSNICFAPRLSTSPIVEAVSFWSFKTLF